MKEILRKTKNIIKGETIREHKKVVRENYSGATKRIL